MIGPAAGRAQKRERLLFFIPGNQAYTMSHALATQTRRSNWQRVDAGFSRFTPMIHPLLGFLLRLFAGLTCFGLFYRSLR